MQSQLNRRHCISQNGSSSPLERADLTLWTRRESLLCTILSHAASDISIGTNDCSLSSDFETVWDQMASSSPNWRPGQDVESQHERSEAGARIDSQPFKCPKLVGAVKSYISASSESEVMAFMPRNTV
jgi:hypothetical protein